MILKTPPPFGKDIILTRTIKYLMDHKVLLGKDVARVAVVTKGSNEEHELPDLRPIRYFHYEYVPPLAYHNPHVTFAYIRIFEKPKVQAALEVTYTNGWKELILARGVTTKELLLKLIATTGGTDCRQPLCVPDWYNIHNNNNVDRVMEDIRLAREKEKLLENENTANN